MIRDPKDLKRYNASERANHWTVGISFILLALSGLAFFHPGLLPADAAVRWSGLGTHHPPLHRGDHGPRPSWSSSCASSISTR